MLERRPLDIFCSALANALGLFIIAFCLVLNNVLPQCNSSPRDECDSSFALDAVQFAAAAVSMLLCLFLHRRPAVYLGGHAVDSQYTTSLFGRWTFSWVNGLLAYAKAEKGLDLKHLPKLHLGVRSEYLHDKISGMKSKPHLWKTLALAHYQEALSQTLLTIVQAAAQFVPSYALYRFLDLLENRSAGQSLDKAGWAWIWGLGISMILASSMETWLFWIVCK